MSCFLLPCLAAETDGSIVLSAKDANYSKDKGVSPENKKTAAKYDRKTGMIWNLAQDAEVTFQVPEGIEGCYDVYLTVSKTAAQFTSQPFCFQIGEGDVFSVPVDCPVSSDAVAKYTADGDEDNRGSLTDSGRFPIAEAVSLKAGDKIKVICSFGAKSASLKGAFYPGALKDMKARKQKPFPVTRWQAKPFSGLVPPLPMVPRQRATTRWRML